MSTDTHSKSVKDFLTPRKVIILHPDASAAQAARVMSERGTGSLLVADGAGNILGLITDRDLACFALQAASGAKTPVSQIMSTRLIAVDESATLADVINAMERNGIRRIPVLQTISAGRVHCLGIITLDDLLASEAVSTEQIAPVVRRQMIRKTAKSDTHREQTIRHFYKRMSQKIELPEDTAQKIIYFILSSLVRRLSYVGAAHLLAQLPSRLQEELLSLPPGPDRNVTLKSILAGLMHEFGMEESAARSAMIKAFASLSEFIEPGEIDHVKSQLPEEFRALFVGPEAARSKLSIA
ncbi:MAG: hypothetical protein A2070_08825 [Bdellovibrionales bacterium GWC1_52_8]|nr:MAG: hypothetical protein A2X97_16755 [Bdellovibrionales bacterium GWA1_52_35]OFZ37270.1 MAG: hypothetical protein A2070_08825 [Bdellovibrionales bacterium GWC1_52_8]HCM39473.1 hypothetical protein [Bdellovibrionales bacterium]